MINETSLGNAPAMLEHKPSAGYYRRALYAARNAGQYGEVFDIALFAVAALEALLEREAERGSDEAPPLCLDVEAKDKGWDVEDIPTARAEVVTAR